MALAQPKDDLFDLAFEAIAEARHVELPSVLERCTTEDQLAWVRQWPGEHYRLLAALMKTLAPALVVEVGTFTGMGALSMLAPDGAARVVTYDIVDWSSVPGSLLRPEDFATGRIEQRLGDLSDGTFFAKEAELLAEADFIFVDGPKDGRFEANFFGKLLPVLGKKRQVVMVDDIHFTNMVQLWMSLPVTKLDVTSFGHWSGTGLMLVP